MSAREAMLAVGVALAAGAAALAEDAGNATPVVPDFRRMGPAERDRAARELLDARRKLIAGLVKQLRSGREGREHIVYLLGKYRARAATEALVRMIDFKAEIRDIATRIGRWGTYPAQEALGRIGKPASRAVRKRLPKEPDKLRRKLMLMVMIDVEGIELAQRMVRRDLESTEGRQERARLKESLEMLDSWRKGPAYRQPEGDSGNPAEEKRP